MDFYYAYNYIYNCLKKAKARKRSAADGAVAFSQIGNDDGPTAFEDALARAGPADRYEAILSRARALDIYAEAMAALADWAEAQPDADDLLAVVHRLQQGSQSAKHPVGRGPGTRRVVARFRELLAAGVLQEVALEPGEDREVVFGREVAILLEALGRDDAEGDRA